MKTRILDPLSQFERRALSFAVAELAAALANLENIHAPIHKAIATADNSPLDVRHSDNCTRITDGKHVVDILPHKQSFTVDIYKAA